MVPHIRIPSHITALYIFAVVNLTLLVNITLVEANISVLNSRNSTLEDIEDLPAKFGSPFPVDGLWGRLYTLEKNEEACHPIEKPPDSPSHVKWIVLIKRNNCDFDQKVLNAQKAGYSAAIVHNVGSDSLIAMGSSGKLHEHINIPSAFIGSADGLMLKNDYGNYTLFSIVIDRKKEFDANLYLLPFAIVVGICFILMLVFMIAKWLHDLRRKRRSRISKEHLKKIPVKKFKKGDDYEMCAICLDEYEDGDKLRILPCAHAYHMKCVDPWLTKSKRLCPLCKKKVIPGDVDDSSSDSDSEDESDRQSETAPLLTAGSPGSAGRSQRDRAALRGVLRGSIQHATDSFSDTSSDDGSASASFYQSSVEVHEQRRGHGNIQSYGATATVTLADETADDRSVDQPAVHGGYTNLGTEEGEEEEDKGAAIVPDSPFLNMANLEGLEGAVGGVDSVGLNIVEDHYHMEVPEKPEQEELLLEHRQTLTASTESSESNSSRDDSEVAIRGRGKKKKTKRKQQNGMV